jgi:DNA polymerase-2
MDIETATSVPQVLSIAVHLSGVDKPDRRVFIQGSEPANGDNTTYFPNERSLLRNFEAWMQSADPDLLIGWNVIGFDLGYLLKRADVLGIPLRLGREMRSYSIFERSGRFSRANVPGRVVLDGPQLLRSSFYSFESYSLENVSQEVLGEGKLIQATNNKAAEIERLFREDKAALVRYNLQDTILVTRIFEKLGLLDLVVKRSKLSGMLLDQVGMSTASLDHFYLPRLHSKGYVAPDVADIRDVEYGSGGYVMAPEAGIYDDIIALDFQSLYPTIIRTFGIDPLSRALADTDPIITPTGFRFSRAHSILPAFIAELMLERREAKARKDTALSQAIKILMNSFYGVMGSAGSRLYHPDLPDAITSTGQWLLVQSKTWLEDLGHRVIYGDTDSLFVALKFKPGLSSREITAQGIEVAQNLTSWWRNKLREEFKVESALVLEFKKHYKKFLIPSARNSSLGAKKRYAGLVADAEQTVEFVGLEVVRSDWTKLAREFQIELYTKIFHGEPIEEWITNFVRQVRAGKFDDSLVYRKRLHKQLDEYGSSPPPYARAARLLAKPSRDVRYVMTLKGPIPLELDPKEPDYQHYIDRQLQPVADSILEVLGKSFDGILSRQLQLF